MSTDPRTDYALRAPRLPEPPDDSLADAPIDEEVRLQMYRSLQLLRQWSKRAHDLFLQNLVKGTTHLSLGMEAIATGFGAAMKDGDYSFATYRGHAHSLARGMDPGAALAELLGRENGILGGKGGSMHLTDVSKGMMGSYAIIGAHLCTANGAAWSAQMRGTDQVAIAFFGDGTTNIGAFHEALNMAKVWNLPTVFVCENNLYMEYTPIDVVTAVEHPAADRAAAYGLEPVLIDGNDPDAVYLAADAALRRARDGRRPVDDRGDHLSLGWPLPCRSRQVPAGRRGRGVGRTRPRGALPGAVDEAGGRGGAARRDPRRGRRADRRGDRVREGRRRAG